MSSAYSEYFEDDWADDRFKIEDYPYLRSIVAEEYARLPAEDLEDVFYGFVDGVDIEDYENFLKNLSKVGKSAGRALGQAAPGALSGALQGATAGAALGPYGALAGGVLGAVGGGLQSHAAANRPAPAAPAQAAPAAAPPAAAPAAVPAAPVATTPAVTTPAPAVADPAVAPVVAARPLAAVAAQPPAATGKVPASAQLLALLQRPETIQALLALVMGQIGRRTVPVESVETPVAEFAHVISTLAERTACEHQIDASRIDDDLPSLAMYDATGDSLDAAQLSEARSTGLLEALDVASIESAWPVDDAYAPFDDEFEDVDDYQASGFDDFFDDVDIDPDLFTNGRPLLG